MSRVAVGSDQARRTLFYNPYQQAFLQALAQRTADGSRAFNRLSLFAGRRGGKTLIGSVAAVAEMQPNTLGWCCAPSYPELEDYVMPAVLSLIPKDWVKAWSQSRRELTLINNARCAFRSLDEPNKARGPGLDWAWIDEARKVQELAWDVLLPALVDNQGTAWFTTTPNGYDWCHRRLWKPAEAGDPGFWACRYYTEENRKIKASEIAAAKRQLDPLFFAQEFQADFVTFTGAVYGGIVEPQVLTSLDEIRTVLPEWPRVDPSRICYVGLDPGTDHPFAAVVAVSTDQGLVQIGEYLARNRPVHDHKRHLVALLAQWNPAQPFQPEQWAIDRSQRQMAIELAQAPYAISVVGAENDVRAGINRVAAWLLTRRYWIVASENPRTIEQLRGYAWEPTMKADGTYRLERPRKVADDLPDAVRYLLMLYPDLPMAMDADPAGVVYDDAAWAQARMSRITAQERGDAPDPDEPTFDGLTPGSSPMSLFAEGGDDRQTTSDDRPGGTGDLWA